MNTKEKILLKPKTGFGLEEIKLLQEDGALIAHQALKLIKAFKTIGSPELRGHVLKTVLILSEF